jgi:hypothetical protein
MHRSRLAASNPRGRWLRPAVLGLAGWITLLVLATLSMGVMYIWLMTGLAPDAQVRQGGLAIVMGWLLGGVFGGVHLAAAFLLERYGHWGIAGITLCLLLLWVLAVRRGRVFRHTVLQRHDGRVRRP